MQIIYWGEIAMAEIKTVNRWFWVWDFEKEEDWLNEMAGEGWALISVGFTKYTFERTEPGEYTVRLEMREKDENYISFMQETGAEYIGRVVQWIYFRKKRELGAFEIFSDLDSRIGHLSRIGKMIGIICLANILIGVANSPRGFGFINLLCGALLAYALGRIQGKKDELERERKFRE